MSALTAAALGGLFGFGLLVAVCGFAGLVPPARIADRVRIDRGDRLLIRAAAAVVCAALAYGWTGWLAAAVFAAAGAAAIPDAVATRRERQRSMDVTEAIAAWAEMFRDTMAAAAGIQEAIVATAPVAPLAIRAAVARLAARLQREPLAHALRDFAARVADPAGDLVVAALLVAGERQAGNLGSVLSAAATSARATATMRLRVETGRARIWTSVRVTVAVFALVAVGLLVFNRGYLRPFDTGTGQLLLFVVGALFAASFWSLSKLSRLRDHERLFSSIEGLG